MREGSVWWGQVKGHPLAAGTAVEVEGTASACGDLGVAGLQRSTTRTGTASTSTIAGSGGRSATIDVQCQP